MIIKQSHISCLVKQSLERCTGEYFAVSNDNEVVRAFRDKGWWQPVEQGITPYQPHGGGADDEQRPVFWVACCNADGL